MPPPPSRYSGPGSPCWSHCSRAWSCPRTDSPVRAGATRGPVATAARPPLAAAADIERRPPAAATAGHPRPSDRPHGRRLSHQETVAFPKADPVPRSTVTARNRMMSGASASMRRPRPPRRLRINHTSPHPASMDRPALPIGLAGSTSAAGHHLPKLMAAAIATSDCGADCSSGRC